MFCDAVSPGLKRVPGKSRHKINMGRKKGREGDGPGKGRGDVGERVREGARGRRSGRWRDDGRGMERGREGGKVFKEGG